MIMAYNVKDRVTSVMRWIDNEPICFFPYCLVGKKGMVKAFFKGKLINVDYKEALKNCSGAPKTGYFQDYRRMIDEQLKNLGVVKTRFVSKTSLKLGITEQLFVGRVSYN
jgi:hypothetical protein